MTFDIDSIDNPNFFFHDFPESVEKLKKFGINKISELILLSVEDLTTIFNSVAFSKKIKKIAKEYLDKNKINIYSDYNNKGPCGSTRGVPPQKNEFNEYDYDLSQNSKLENEPCGWEKKDNFAKYREYDLSLTRSTKKNNTRGVKNDNFRLSINSIFNDLFEVDESKIKSVGVQYLDIIESRFEEKIRWIRILKYKGTSRAIYLLLEKGFTYSSELAKQTGLHRKYATDLLNDFIGFNIIEPCEFEDIEYNYLLTKPGIFEFQIRQIQLYRITDQARIFFNLPQIKSKIELIMNNINLKKFCIKEKKSFEFFKKRIEGGIEE